MNYFPKTLLEVREALEKQVQTGKIYKGIESKEEALKVIMEDETLKSIYESTLKQSKISII